MLARKGNSQNVLGQNETNKKNKLLSCLNDSVVYAESITNNIIHGVKKKSKEKNTGQTKYGRHVPPKRRKNRLEGI